MSFQRLFESVEWVRVVKLKGREDWGEPLASIFDPNAHLSV